MPMLNSADDCAHAWPLDGQIYTVKPPKRRRKQTLRQKAIDMQKYTVDCGR